MTRSKNIINNTMWEVGSAMFVCFSM